MKNLQLINAFAIGLPIMLGLIGLGNEEFLIFALIATIITGILQLILGIVFWFKQQESKLIKIYFGLVGLYFISISSSMDLDLYVVLIGAPILLAIFLTVILHLPIKEN